MLAGVTALVLLVGLNTGCSAIGYYGQAVSGQWQLLRARQDVDELLRQDIEPELRANLELVQAIKQFARTHMGMDPGARYSSFVQLPGDYVVWNVFAAGEFDVSGEHWCYPFVGCAPYRGYFKEEAAQRFAAGLREKGLETYVGGVPAYSTLGWFEDPLLSAFINWPEPDLVNLLLHELAHGEVWVKDDVAFNESFASFVAEQGMREWFAANPATLDQWQADRQAWARLRALLLALRDALEHAYAQPTPRIEDKQRLFAAARTCYANARQTLGNGRYDALMQRLNNALLVSVSTYADWMQAFAQLFSEQQGNWPAFFAAVDALGERDPSTRQARLQTLTQQQIDQGRNDDDANQIECEALAHHGSHVEAL